MIVLDRKKYQIAMDAVKKIPFNTLFAETVIKREVDGTIYADDASNPSVFYILHPYGMSLLCGSVENMNFNKRFCEYCLNRENIRKSYDFMQVYPFKWEGVLDKILGNNIARYRNGISTAKIRKASRINFKFSSEKYRKFLSLLKKTNDLNISVIDAGIYSGFKGSVIPENFFKNYNDFEKRGKGFTLLSGNIPVSIAFSSFITENRLELGMETDTSHRGKGYASIICSKLIDFSIKNGYDPVWACMYENTASFNLAKKLGFEENLKLPYYILGV